MQHVLRYWKRQSGGSEYKKLTPRRSGFHPDPEEGAFYSAPANPLGGEGLTVPSPRTPSPRSRPFRPPKLVPTPLCDSDERKTNKNDNIQECDI